MTGQAREAKVPNMPTRNEARAEPNEEAPGAKRRYVIHGQPVTAPALPGGLHLVATPIGNLRDVTLRALEVLAAADLIACEDTRVTRKLLDHYGIATPLTPYHDHNAAQARPKILARLAEGAAVALVSDAGTPLISDPGFKLVRAARAAGCAVTALPGASAAVAALIVSGLPTDRFFFEGFLPAKRGQRRARIADLAHIPASLALYETGPRLASALADLAEGLGARRRRHRPAAARGLSARARAREGRAMTVDDQGGFGKSGGARPRPLDGQGPRPERQIAFRMGLSAESRAAALLIAKGFRILARRWKSPVGEIDIAARRRKLLVFVEVKARETLDDAAWSVTPRQKARIVAAEEA
jgi:siroheme synthase